MSIRTDARLVLAYKLAQAFKDDIQVNAVEPRYFWNSGLGLTITKTGLLEEVLLKSRNPSLKKLIPKGKYQQLGNALQANPAIGQVFDANFTKARAKVKGEWDRFALENSELIEIVRDSNLDYIKDSVDSHIFPVMKAMQSYYDRDEEDSAVQYTQQSDDLESLDPEKARAKARQYHADKKQLEGMVGLAALSLASGKNLFEKL